MKSVSAQYVSDSLEYSYSIEMGHRSIAQILTKLSKRNTVKEVILHIVISLAIQMDFPTNLTWQNTNSECFVYHHMFDLQ